MIVRAVGRVDGIALRILFPADVAAVVAGGVKAFVGRVVAVLSGITQRIVF